MQRANGGEERAAGERLVARSGQGTQPAERMMSNIYQQVYEIVRRIPRGRVLTYGLVANLLEHRLSAQAVGWALRALPATLTGKPAPTAKRSSGSSSREAAAYSAATVPWHRVVNSSGRLSTHKNPDIPEGLQRRLLEAEGVRFNKDDQIDLDRYLWLDGLTS